MASSTQVLDRLETELSDALGSESVNRSDAVREQHGRDESSHPPAPPDLVVYPARVEDIVAVVERCRETGTPIVPFGAGTSLEGHVAALEGGVCVDLTRMIRAIELTREQVYIANVVKCRPPGNREPQPDEVAACAPYLEGQIDAVRPAVIVCLGRVAAQTLLGTDAPIGRLRGSWYEVRGVPTLATYHPAALLRNAALKRPTWEDLQQVRDRLRSTAG